MPQTAHAFSWQSLYFVLGVSGLISSELQRGRMPVKEISVGADHGPSSTWKGRVERRAVHQKSSNTQKKISLSSTQTLLEILNFIVLIFFLFEVHFLQLCQ